jgi:3-oxoacyl-[acyl-carrier protein] reductase
LVTGAGGGIGQAVARAFATRGASLALAGRTLGKLDDTASNCEGASTVLVEACDISVPEAVARLVTRIDNQLGGIDLVVNAAGVHGAIGPVHECDPAAWRRAIDVNLYGSFLLARATSAGMLARGHGRIILFSGGGATGPLPGFSAYAASKAGVVRLVETLAEELAPHVQVNAIAPGLVDTAILDNVLAAGPRAGAEYEQVRRVRAGELASVPSELAAELAVFLGLEASDELTGRLISAPHDPWQEWRNGSTPEAGLYTLRRLDAHTVRPLLGALS